MRTSTDYASTSRVEGSFRDPAGYVFLNEGRVFRTLDPTGTQLFNEILPQLWFQNLFSSGTLIRTQPVNGAPRVRFQELHPDAAAFLEHERLTWVSYPYEWCFSMLADAALRTVELQEELALHGLGIKDASAYNVQFRSGQPVFIDLGSVERPRRTDLWFALGQFNRMFLFPLLMARHKGWDLRSYFLGALDGRGVEQISRSFSRLDWIRPSLWLDLWLPLLLERRHASRSGVVSKTEAHQGNVQAQLLNLRRLRRKIEKLAAGYKTRSVWSNYTGICNYNETANQGKKDAIRAFLEEHRPERVLDLGCNTGEYTQLASSRGARVVAADADHDAVELLYRKNRSERREIHPLVLDIANPSPAIGYMNGERPSFFERNDADCVFALALIHHLLVSANFSLEAICNLFARLSSKYLVLEFVPREDSMFQRLVKFRVDLYAEFNLESCKKVFSRTFELLKEQKISGSDRTLLFYRKRE